MEKMTKEEVCDYIREYSEECVRTHYDRPEMEQVSGANGVCWEDVLVADIDEEGTIWVSDCGDTRNYENDGGKMTKESVRAYVDNWLSILWEQDREQEG